MFGTIMGLAGLALSGYSAYSSSQRAAASEDRYEKAQEEKRERERKYRKFLGEEHAATKEDIREGAADQKAKARQSLINRGLYNTSALGGAFDDISEQKQEDIEAANRQYEKAYTQIGGYGGAQGPSRAMAHKENMMSSLQNMGQQAAGLYDEIWGGGDQQTQNPYLSGQNYQNLTGLSNYSGAIYQQNAGAGNWAGLNAGQSMNAPTQGADGIGAGGGQGMSSYPVRV